MVNHHPASILPLFCITILSTAQLKPFPMLKVLSIEPSLFKRTILFAVVHLYSEKVHQIIIFPLD